MENIKATDLMIGNYLLHQGENIVQVDGIYEDELHTVENGYKPINEFGPIPLDEKWLVDFGFEKFEWTDNTAFIKLKLFDRYTHFMMRLFKDKWHARAVIIKKDKRGNYVDESKDIHIDFKYVHTLQNFFSLKNKQLTI